MATTVCSWTELGVNNGRSMLGVGLGLRKNGLLQLVDRDFPRGFWDNWRWLRNRRPDLRIVIAECDSVEAARYLSGTHVVFVDADHETESVVRDIAAWRGKCVTLCGHDYQPLPYPKGHQEVIDAVDRCFSEGVDIPVGTIWWARREWGRALNLS
jgi:hypothetical protein